MLFSHLFNKTCSRLLQKRRNSVNGHRVRKKQLQKLPHMMSTEKRLKNNYL